MNEYYNQEAFEFPTSEVDPRVAMKEVRAEVKLYVEGKSNPHGLNNLGELPLDMDHARRIIIALQDMLDDQINRHARASDHIAGMMAVADTVDDIYQINTEQLEQSIEALVDELHEAKGAVHYLTESQNALIVSLDESTEVLREASDTLQKKNDDIFILKSALKLVMEG